MPTKPRLIELLDKPATDSEPLKGSQGTLRDIVRDALLNVLSDQGASAAAKASAGRTLMQFFADENQSLSTRRGADMTAAELDAAIASHPSRIPE